MKKLVFLITAWLVHVQVLCSTDSFDLTEADVEKIFDSISEEMLLALKSSFAPPSHRQRRGLEAKQSLIDYSGVYRLKSVRPVSKLCYPAIQTLFLDVSNITYAVCLSASTVNDPARMVIGYYQEPSWRPFYEQYVNNPVHAEAFYFQNHIYVLVADSEIESGTQMIKINLHTRSIDLDHSVTSSYATSVAVWKMKIDGNYNLAITSTEGYDADNFRSQVSVFKWTGTYFDKYSEFPAFDVKDLEPFHIHDAAYIAVANFRRNSNNNKVDSEILRYDLDSGLWVSHQKIRTYGAMDWEFFSLGVSLGQEFFLALANKGDGDKNGRLMIYKFVLDKFVPFQCLQTTEATSIASFSNEGMFILAVANEEDAVNLYQYDGWRFIKSGVQMTREAMSDGVQHLIFHTVKRDSIDYLILSVSNPRHPFSASVFEIGFVHENSLQEWNTKSTDWCLNTLSKLESDDINKTFDNFEDLVFVDQPITINGDLVFEKGFVADTLNTPKLTSITTKEVYDSSLLAKLAELQRRLEEIKQKLDGFSKVLNNSLKIEGNQTITNRLEFQDVEFNCVDHSCHFENIYTSVLNQESISDWKNKLVFLDSEQVIDGDLWAKEINASSIHVQGLIDGVDSRSFVTKSGSHSVKGYKTFNSISAHNVVVSGKVDGVVISPADVLVTTGHQTLYGEITFEDVTTTWLNVDYVNERNLTAFYRDLVLADKSYTVTGHKTFKDVTIDELFMTLGSTINGVDLMDLWNNALWINGKQEINGDIIFSDVAFKNLKLSGGINGIRIPGKRVVDITESAYITAPQSFENSTKFGSLTVLDSLNGMSLVQAPDGSKQLDIMLKNGDQIVTGLKTFHTIHLGDHSSVGGTVDGVDLSKFKESVLRKDSTVFTNGTWVFKAVTFKGPLTIQGYVSGAKLEDVYSRALKLNESLIPDMVFRELVYVDDLKSNDINGKNVQTDLVLKTKPQNLTGRYNFAKIIIEENAEILGLVNGKSFRFLNEVLLKIGSQRIKSKVFNRNVKIGNLTVTGTINNIPMTDIVTLKGGKISGSRQLVNVAFSHIDAKNIEVTGTVNDINLKEMIEDTMTYDGSETVTGEKIIDGTVHILDGTNLETGTLNSVDIRKLFEDAVFIDVPQNITGRKTFLNNAVFADLGFNGTFDGVTEWEMKNNWMLKDAPQTIENEVVFEKGFSAKDIKVTTVNDLNLKDLELEIVKVNEQTEINGTVIFEKMVISDGDVGLLGKIQGIDFSEEAVLRDNVVVTGEKIFSEDLVIKGDITVDGLVDTVNIEDLCDKTFLRNKEVNISRLVIKGDVTLLGGAVVSGNLAGVDLSLFKEIAVENASEIKFKGLKTFNSLALTGPVTLTGYFGNVDLKKLSENYMSITRDQEIPADMAFDDLSFTGVLSVINLDTANKKINNIDLPTLSGRILKTRGTQDITASYYINDVHFESDVSVVGNASGIELPSGLMIHNHTNYIRGQKIFEEVVIVEENLEMADGSLVQDVDVSAWFRKSVLKDGKFDVYGHKTFSKLELYDVKVEGELAGVHVSEKILLMTYGDQVILKPKLIEGDVIIEGSLTVNGLINTVNLTQLSAETLQRDRNNTVTGLKYFKQPLTIASLEAPTVAGIDIVQLKDKLNQSLDLDPLERHLEDMESMILHLQKAFDSQAVLFQYYELFEKFNTFSVYDWLYVSGPDCGELLLLSDSSGSSSCPSIRIFRYDEIERSFEFTGHEFPTSYDIPARGLTVNNVTHLFVANRNQDCSCTDNLSVGNKIDIYTWKEQDFEMLHPLEVDKPFDMVVFNEGNTACIVVLEITGSKVYCAYESNHFKQTEELLSTDGHQAAIVQSLGRTLLAIVSNNIYDGFIDIYVWNSAESKFGIRKQYLQFLSVQSIVLINHKEEGYEKVYLVIAEESIPEIHNVPHTHVYRLEESKGIFEKYQEINDYGVLEWINLETREVLLFVVDSRQGLVKIYQHKGVSGFVKTDTIKSLGVKKIRPFVRSDPEDSLNHYLALAGSECNEQPTRSVYHAKILKSKLAGMRPIS